MINSREDGRVRQFDKNLGRLWMPCTYSRDAATIALLSRTRVGLDWVLTLATVSDERITKVRDVPLAADEARVATLRFSRSGDAVAVALSGPDTRVWVFDTRSGALIKRFTTANRVTHLAVSMEDQLIVTWRRLPTPLRPKPRRRRPPSILPNSPGR
jgi:WD40 repeat protein